MARALEYLIYNLDLLGSISLVSVGAVVAGIGYVSGNPPTTEVGLAVLMAALVYLLLIRNKARTATHLNSPSPFSLTLVLNIIFFSSLVASLFLMHASLYRPLLYFFMLSAAAAALAFETGITRSNSQTWLMLAKILLLSVVIRAGLYYEIPGFIGNDGWIHQAMMETWIDREFITRVVPNIPGGFAAYADFPAMHLLVITVRTLTTLGPKDSLFLSGMMFTTTLVFSLFLVGRRLLDRQGGLLAALLLAISVPDIVSGTTIIPMSLGLVFFAALLCLVFIKRPNTNPLFILFAVVLVFTHTIAAFVTLITLTIVYLANEWYQKMRKATIEPMNISFSAVMLLGVLLVGHWTYSYTSPAQSFFENVASGFIRSLLLQTQFEGQVLRFASESALSRMWFLIFTGGLITGSLSWLHRYKQDNVKVSLVLSAAGLSAISFILPLFHIRNLIAERWLPFIGFLGAILVAQGIRSLSSVLSGRVRRLTVSTAFIFILTVFMLNSGSVNMQTPFYPEPGRVGFVQSELSAADTLLKNGARDITTDWGYATLVFLAHQGFADLTYLDPHIETGDFIVLRTYMVEHPELWEYNWRSQIGKPTPEETTAFLKKFGASMSYSLVYDNNTVLAYTKSRSNGG